MQKLWLAIKNRVLPQRESGKGKRLPAFLLPALLVFFAVLSVTAIVMLLQDQQERDKGRAAYESLAETIVTIQKPTVGEETPSDETESDPQPAQPMTEETTPTVEVDFHALMAINPHSVAWICSDDGDISYPVVQGTDNAYYLNHLPDGTSHRNGSIFLDFRNQADFSDPNSFIYGHNMLDGTMFANLSRYFQEGYYEQHPTLLLVTPAQSYNLQVFAGCVVPGNSDVYQLTYQDTADFAAYVEKVKAMSAFSAPVEVEAGDRLVTLSTCSYDYEDARYVIFCRLIPIE